MSIKTSKANSAIIERLKQTYDFKYYYVPARIAIAYSLQLNKKFDFTDFGSLAALGAFPRIDIGNVDDGFHVRIQNIRDLIHI